MLYSGGRHPYTLSRSKRNGSKKKGVKIVDLRFGCGHSKDLPGATSPRVEREIRNRAANAPCRECRTGAYPSERKPWNDGTSPAGVSLAEYLVRTEEVN